MSRVAFHIFNGWSVDPASKDMLWRFERVRIAEEFGWPLTYVDTLTQRDVLDIYGVWDAKAKKRELEKSKAESKAKARRGRRR